MLFVGYIMRIAAIVLAGALALAAAAAVAEEEPTPEPGEGEVLVQAFRGGQVFYTVVAWKAVPEVDGNELYCQDEKISIAGTTIKTTLGPLDTVDFSQQLWLEVGRTKADGTTKVLGTRKQLSSVPYAMWALSPAGPAGTASPTTAGAPRGRHPPWAHRGRESWAGG